MNKAGGFDACDLGFGVMASPYVGAVYVVAATRGDVTIYWAAATERQDAVIAVDLLLGPGWTTILTDKRLSSAQIEALHLSPNTVRELQNIP